MSSSSVVLNRSSRSSGHDDAPEPFLPPEIIENILHRVANDNPELTAALLLVSPWFFMSLQARLQEVVVLIWPSTSLKFLDALRSQPNTLAKAVKALYISVFIDRGIAAQILQACSGVTDIACWLSDPFALIGMAGLRPQHLALPIATGHSPSNIINFNKPFFTGVTHLSIAEDSFLWKQWDWTAFRLLPKLTHVQLQLPILDAMHPESAHASVFRILGILPKLEVLLFHFLSRTRGPGTMAMTGVEAYCAGLRMLGDPRCVFRAAPHPKTIRKEVQETAFRQWDRWRWAEEVVEEQKRELVMSGPVAFF
ncbi:hypothetical protein GALMADRAFT_219073 [Galerina marginata CBS 339.88]|uniref:F-box domain-containing protein n=1 Tax=Galerina marginata (strain CBS 339.88) TaxID=685588 RepID=A0A067U186_GALM3|nr:hypothetical protein GALMADRAFT_219073 [Galerina marginata CBS 339.88]